MCTGSFCTKFFCFCVFVCVFLFVFLHPEPTIFSTQRLLHSSAIVLTLLGVIPTPYTSEHYGALLKQAEWMISSFCSRLACVLRFSQKVMLVYFVGGVSYMEIAALRFLNAQRECKYFFTREPFRVPPAVGMLWWVG